MVHVWEHTFCRLAPCRLEHMIPCVGHYAIHDPKGLPVRDRGYIWNQDKGPRRNTPDVLCDNSLWKGPRQSSDVHQGYGLRLSILWSWYGGQIFFNQPLKLLNLQSRPKYAPHWHSKQERFYRESGSGMMCITDRGSDPPSSNWCGC